MKKLISTIVLVAMLVTTLAVIPMSASAANWYDPWTFVGSAKKEGDAVILDSVGNGNQGYIEYKCIGPSLDVEWDLSVEKYNATECVQLCTGAHRLFIKFTVGGISVQTASAWTKYNYDIGTDEHHYRVYGTKDIGYEFYIDDELVGKLETYPAYTGRAGLIHIWNQGNESGDAKMTVRNVVSNPYRAPGAAVEEEEEVDPTVARPFRYDFEDGEDQSKWMSTSGGWQVSDGTLWSNNNVDQQYWSIKHMFDYGNAEDFVFNARLKIEHFGNDTGFQLFYPGRTIQISIRPNFISYNTTTGNAVSDRFSLETGRWYDFKVETYNKGKNAVMTIDGVPMMDFAVASTTRTDYHVYIYTTGIGLENAYTVFDYVEFIPSVKEIAVTSPYYGAEYLEGEKITLRANVMEPVAEEGQEPPAPVEAVEYQINGKTVATGYAPDYVATLEGLPAGFYQVSAVAGEKSGQAISFTVRPDLETSIKADWQGDLNLSLDVYDGMAQIAETEYFVDGVSVGKANQAPYNMTVSGLSNVAHRIQAVCKDQTGIIVAKESTALFPDLSAGQTTTNYSYEVSYTVNGDGGSAEAIVANGMHKLHLTHTPEKVTYKTRDGEESFDLSTGHFQILTDGIYADVYRNGQLAFSYFMPQTEEVLRDFKSNGMNMENPTLSIPDIRGNYLTAYNVSGKQDWNLADLPYYYNLDFIANQKENAHFVVMDGYYRLNLTMKDGKFYVWTAKKNNALPYELQVADAVAADNVYYRVEMAGGMARLYGNGKWLATFRGAQTLGQDAAAVEVSGTLKYVNINDYTDLYFYSDDFSGNGEFSSSDYWVSKTSDPYVDTEDGEMMLNALGKKDMITEMHVYVGECEFEAEVEVKDRNGGFWFMTDHNVTPSYSKLGYNFETGNYEYVYIMDNKVYDNLTITVPGELPQGTFTMAMKAKEGEDGNRMALYINGEEIIETPAPDRRGKIGFIQDDCVGLVKRVSYRGDEKILLATTDWRGGPTTADMIETEDEIIVVSGGNGVKTSDGGKNWQTYNMPQSNMWSENTLQLDNGKILSFQRRRVDTDENGRALYTYFCCESLDYGQTWKELCRVMPDALPGRLSMQNRLTQGHSGRIYFACSETNDEEFGALSIWYSDDEGRSWTCSETYMDGVVEDLCIQEGVIIETLSGITRCYFRNDMGMLHYYNSYDYGKTWDLTPHALPMLSSMTCYNIGIDPADGAIYIAWGYDNANLGGRPQFPRNRWGVAKSYDDGESWEWIGSAHDNNQPEMNMMNLNINISKDYLIMNCFSWDDSAAQTWYGRQVVVEKRKQKTTKRFGRLHYRFPSAIEKTSLFNETKKAQALMVHPESNTAIIGGNRLEGVANGNAVALSVAARFVGATIIDGENGGVALKTGDSAVQIPASALSNYNGQKMIDLDAFAKEYGYFVVDVHGTKVISPYEHWGNRQTLAFSFAADLFNNTMIEIK